MAHVVCDSPKVPNGAKTACECPPDESVEVDGECKLLVDAIEPPPSDELAKRLEELQASLSDLWRRFLEADTRMTACADAACRQTEQAQKDVLKEDISRVINNIVARGGSPRFTLPETSPETTPASGGGGGGGGSGLAIGIGAAALLGIGLWALAGDGDPSAFALKPLAAYEMGYGGESLRYGSRLEYRGDSWSLWWEAEESDGDARLGYGGEWRGEVLRASAGAEVSGEDDVALRGIVEGEWLRAGWRIRPAVRGDVLREVRTGEFRVRVERVFGPGR